MSVRLLQLITLLIAVAGVWYYGWFGLLVSFALYLVMNVLIGNAMMHRYYGHKSFELREELVPLSRWLVHHLPMGSVIGWAGYHRLHHKHSDTDQDIHSPTIQGLGHIIWGVWKSPIPSRMIRDLMTPELMWWHRNYFYYHAAVIVVLGLLAPWVLVFVYAVPNLLCLISANTIAIIPHLAGHAEDSVVTDIITFGEGKHKYHHDHPREYRYGKFDITGIAIERLLVI